MREPRTCPACGYETLDTIELQEDTDFPVQRGMVLLECFRCLWRGSSATLSPM